MGRTKDPARSADAARNLRILAVFSWFTYPFAIVPLYYFLVRARGLDLGDFARLQAIYYLGMVACELPTGWLADRAGRRTAMAAGPIVLALAFFLMAAAADFGAFALAAILQAVGHSLLSGPPSALLFETLLHEGRAPDYLRLESLMSTYRTAGTAAAFLLGGVTGSLFGLPAVAALTGLLCLGAAAAALRLREPPARRLSGKRPPFVLRRLVAILARPGVRWLLASYVLLFFLLRFGFHTYQPWLEEARRQGPLFVGLLYASFGLVALPFTRLAHPLGRRLGERRALSLLPPLLSVSFLGLSLGTSLALVPLFYLQQVPFGLHWPLVHSYANQRLPSRDRALALSALSFAARLLFALLLPLVLTGTRQVTSVFFDTGLCTLVLGLLLIPFGRDRGTPTAGAAGSNKPPAS